MLIRVSDYSNCPGICNIRHFIRMQYMHSDVVLRSRIFFGGCISQINRVLWKKNVSYSLQEVVCFH